MGWEVKMTVKTCSKSSRDRKPEEKAHDSHENSSRFEKYNYYQSLS